jgi:hypothetical protein
MEDIPLTVTAGSFKRTVTRSSVDWRCEVGISVCEPRAANASFF